MNVSTTSTATAQGGALLPDPIKIDGKIDGKSQDGSPLAALFAALLGKPEPAAPRAPAQQGQAPQLLREATETLELAPEWAADEVPAEGLMGWVLDSLQLRDAVPAETALQTTLPTDGDVSVVNPEAVAALQAHLATLVEVPSGVVEDGAEVPVLLASSTQSPTQTVAQTLLSATAQSADQATPQPAPQSALQAATPITSLPADFDAALSQVQADAADIAGDIDASLMDAVARTVEDGAAPLHTASAAMTPSVMNAADARPHAPAQPPMQSHAPLDTRDQAQWTQALHERIAWQLNEGLGEATLELHPAELGALTIRIETQGQVAQVLIMAADPAARALLQQTLPQLRELLTASGLSMSQGKVEAMTREDAGRGGSGRGARGEGNVRRRIGSIALVDAYA